MEESLNRERNLRLHLDEANNEFLEIDKEYKNRLTRYVRLMEKTQAAWELIQNTNFNFDSKEFKTLEEKFDAAKDSEFEQLYHEENIWYERRVKAFNKLAAIQRKLQQELDQRDLGDSVYSQTDIDTLPPSNIESTDDEPSYQIPNHPMTSRNLQYHERIQQEVRERRNHKRQMKAQQPMRQRVAIKITPPTPMSSKIPSKRVQIYSKPSSSATLLKHPVRERSRSRSIARNITNNNNNRTKLKKKPSFPIPAG